MLISTFCDAYLSSVDNVAKTASDRIIAEREAKIESEYAKLSGGLNKTV